MRSDHPFSYDRDGLVELLDQELGRLAPNLIKLAGKSFTPRLNQSITRFGTVMVTVKPSIPRSGHCSVITVVEAMMQLMVKVT